MCHHIISFTDTSALSHRTTMAAAAQSRRVAGVLLFLFTLLCLICLTTSRIDKKEMKKLKKSIQKTQKEIDNIKSQRANILEILDDYMSITDSTMTSVKKAAEESSDHFKPLDGFLDTIKSIMETTKTFIDGQNEGFDARIAVDEQKVGIMKKLLKAMEEDQAEL